MLQAHHKDTGQIVNSSIATTLKVIDLLSICQLNGTPKINATTVKFYRPFAFIKISAFLFIYYAIYPVAIPSFDSSIY